MSDETNNPMTSGAQPGGHDGAEGHPARNPQIERDLEIEMIQAHSRHQVPSVLHAPEVPPATPEKTRKAVQGVLGLLAVLLVAGGATLIAQVVHGHNLARRTELAAVPDVAVVHPRQESPDEQLVLPCSLEAFEESPIYARTNGYLLRWYRDIGSHVAKGELLADIDTPEVDQELNQARAARQQIKARLDLARISAERWQKLLTSHSVSEQETDEQSSSLIQAQANLADADANVRRLEELEGFKKVYAPFTGVLTKRNVDPGALINAGAGAAGRELFTMAQVDPLRIFSNVPQTDAPYTRAGTKATITLREYPGQTFAGVVARTSEAINSATRTLLTEVDIPNKDGHLLPGSFGEVHFSVGTGANKVTIPVNALLFRSEGSCVAVVGADGKVALRHIDIGRDFGSTLEVLSGVTAADRVIVNPADSIEDGQKVNVVVF